MREIDYNGEGAWSAEAIIRRYDEYARRFGIDDPISLRPSVHVERGTRWVYPVMDQVIDGIKADDPGCVQIGIELIEQDRGFAFGAILKSDTARELRRSATLSDSQVSRIRERVVAMLESGVVPREYREYSKLLRRIGIGPHWHRIEAATPRNRYAQRAKAYFVNHCRSDVHDGT
ncbi:MAG: hypothetical protein MI919_14265 [Holophagales bacterium]|nr:hypothetical protein [Holophagales bacterium]